METVNRTVIGVFPNRSDANQAIDDLTGLGYTANDISVIVRDNTVRTQVTNSTDDNVVEGAATGAATGGALGAVTGLLIGIGAITLPGIGALFIGGPIAAALGLTGAAAATVSGAASGALAGGLLGGLVGLGLPEETARIYESRIREGAVVLAVPILGTIDEMKVEHIFSGHGAQEIRRVGRSV